MGEKAKTTARISNDQRLFETAAAQTKAISLKELRKRASYTMDERFWRWACMAVIWQHGKARTVKFQIPYRELFDQLVLSAALDGRYKGNGEIVITRKAGLITWLKMQNQLKATN